MIPLVSDIHTHNPNALNAVINLSPGMAMRPNALYSIGWHPWWPKPNMDWVTSLSLNPKVVIIGECGIDKLKGVGEIQQQIQLTKLHAQLAERVGKPLLLHIVGAWNEIIALHKEIKPSQPWIIHGFRGKPQLAKQLINAGFYISLGSKFNPLTEAVIPAERLLRETD